MRHIQREARPLLRAAEAEGWSIRWTKKGHIRMTSPDGKLHIGYSGTPSDWRAVKNLRTKMRHAGIAV